MRMENLNYELNMSDEEYHAYLKREVELAKLNIRTLRKRGFQVSPSETLHSARTFTIAMRELDGAVA